MLHGAFCAFKTTGVVWAPRPRPILTQIWCVFLVPRPRRVCLRLGAGLHLTFAPISHVVAIHIQLQTDNYLDQRGN